MVKPSSLQAFAHRPALFRSKCGFENRIKNTFFIRSVSAYRGLLIAAVLVVTIVQHRTSVLDKTACVCSKTSRVEYTKNVHNRPKPAVFVRTTINKCLALESNCETQAAFVVHYHNPDTRAEKATKGEIRVTKRRRIASRHGSKKNLGSTAELPTNKPLSS